MPSLVKTFTPDTSNMPEVARPEGLGVVGVVTGTGEDCAQVKIQTLAASQTGRYGVRVGKTGQLMRCNIQGEVYELTGPDRWGGVTVESMPDNSTYADTEPAIEIAYSAGDGEVV